MSIWQNFKDTDHSFEKKFFGVIFSMVIIICFFLLVDKILNKFPSVNRLFIYNSEIFLFFIFGLFVVFIVTASLYYRSLDFVEAETNETIKALIKNVIIWSIYWLAWSIFCAWLTLNNSPLSTSVQFVIISLVFVPGFIAFIISTYFRRQDIRDEEKSKLAMGDNYYKSDPYTLCLSRKYYSGYYGLICLPVYFISIIIGYMI